MDFGPGTASQKGNVGPPSLSTAALPSLPHRTQLLVLGLEGVAGVAQAEGTPGLGSGKAYSPRFRPYQATFSPPPLGTLGSPFSLSLWL